MVNFCAIVGCAMRADRDAGRSFFRIPAVVTRQGEQTREVSQRRRDGWLSRISRADVKESSIKYMRVCDLHFVSGHPSDLFPPDTTDWLPSLNLGHNEVPTPPPGAPARAVHPRNRKRRKVLEAAESLVALQIMSSSDCATGGCEPMEDHKYMRQPEEEETGQACQTDLTGVLITGMQDEINRLTAENLELKKQLAAAYAQHLPVQVMDYFFTNTVSEDSCPHPGPQEKELPQHHDCRETVDFKTEPDCWDGPDPSQIKEEPEEVELQHFKQEQEEPEPLQMEEHEEPDTSQEGERLTLKFEVLEYMGQPVVQLQLFDDRSTAGETAPPSPPSNTSVAPPDGPASQSAESNPSSPSQAEGVKPGPVNDMVIRSARPKERRVGEGIRSNLYRGVTLPLPEISTLRVDEVYHDLPSDTAPLITTMAISNDVPLVDSLFGEVQEGSVLSYHMPAKKVPKTSPHSHAPCPPQLPLANYRLPASQAEASFVFTEHQKLHMSTLQTSLHQAHTIENSTKRQSSCHEWHELRRPRVTSTKFREICHYRGVTSAKNLAKRLLGPSHQTEDMKRGLDKEPVAVEEYCRLMEVNHYPCGFLIHPDAPWMGCSPGGVVFDPRGEPMFGLVEVKCPNVASYVDCPYIKISEGTETLRKSHPYYWQIQGQMLISGLDWCDFVVYAQEDMFIKRIPRDEEVTETIKEKVDSFFFNFYLPAFLEEQSK